MKRWFAFLFLFFLLQKSNCIAQDYIGQRLASGHNHEFFLSGGYNKTKTKFVDIGLRYVHWTNDGQMVLSFGGPAAGCEFSLKRADQVFIPYIGWQGHHLFMAYGLRAEYAFNKEHQVFGLTPEIGFSLIELVRVTAGYRFGFVKQDPLNINGFRFSIIGSIPLSLIYN